MTVAQNLKIYEILAAQFGQPERARELTEAIEAVVSEKVTESNGRLESILRKDLEIVEARIKSELSKTIYIVGLVQFLAIVGSVIGLLSFMHR